MNVISIQSSVAFGHVGNSAAVFALQRLGHEVWPIETAILAHHPGHGGWHGRVTTAEEMNVLLDGIEKIGALGSCDAVLSGYLGDPSQGNALMEAVRRVRAANPRACFACDPVMGDEAKGFYVRDGIPKFLLDRAVPAADIVFPNAFELGWLTDTRIADIESAHAAAASLIRRAPKLVVVTGLRQESPDGARIGALATDGANSWFADCPVVQAPANGTGDLFAALFLGRYLNDGDVPDALSHAVSAVYAVMAETARTKANELSLIAAQDELLRPKRLFKPRKIG